MVEPDGSGFPDTHGIGRQIAGNVNSHELSFIKVDRVVSPVSSFDQATGTLPHRVEAAQ
jgi:hypothetical protein